VARLLPANSRIVMKIRYRKNGVAATDRSRVGLYFATGPVDRTLNNIALIPAATTIPAQADRHRIQTSYPIDRPAELLAIRPLLFPFARSIEATAHRPDGTSEILIWTRSYRFDWQPAYHFKRPVALPPGTRLEITAYLDNSDRNPNNPHRPPEPVRFAQPLCELMLARPKR
jgi:hypothetical protein